MKNIIMFWMLTKIHKAGLCKYFHAKHNTEIHSKGWCFILQMAYDIFNSPVKMTVPRFKMSPKEIDKMMEGIK